MAHSLINKDKYATLKVHENWCNISYVRVEESIGERREKKTGAEREDKTGEKGKKGHRQKFQFTQQTELRKVSSVM